MRNPDCLPFPEPDSQETAQLAAAFLVFNEADPGYTEELARQDAATFLEYRNAVSSGFLHETGVVQLKGGAFYMGPGQSSETK